MKGLLAGAVFVGMFYFPLFGTTADPSKEIAAPPGSLAFSTTATRWPKYAACTAPFSPAGPEPRTTRS